MTPDDPAIAVTDLVKRYGNRTVLDGIGFHVARGTVFALLGANGAGKTTTVDILSTLTPPDRGNVSVAGHDLREAPQHILRAISLTGQYSAVDKILTGTENLHLMADLHHLGKGEGRRRTTELIERFDLENAAHRRAGTYSGGMARRLDIAMSLVGHPEVLFLDEPTTGLDPRSRQEMWTIVGELTRDGVTVFLTTQYLDEADELADRIAVLDHGRIAAEGTAAELKRLVPGGHIELGFDDPGDFERVVRDLPNGNRNEDKLTVEVDTDGSVASLKSVLDSLDPSVTVDRIEIHTPTLDDVFFALTDTGAVNANEVSREAIAR
ncbi:ATP-binding cassette domain-containing protein [Rhodococcus sp. NPDC058521]|uniref:ATP-binding cassette domain-containing protein n=1 Tax=Rhodococcus sp. NPDC058521 TaxID=3346536 RepID=UPI00365A5928